MDAGNTIALVSAGLAGIVAIWVPWLAFRFALRQEHVRWLRENRAELYVDMLTEAYAEQQWLQYEMAEEAVRGRSSWFTDLRLPPMDRARLATRANVFGSRAVNRFFAEIQRIGFEATIGRAGPYEEVERVRVRIAVGRAMEELEKAVRAELGADAIRLSSNRPTVNPAGA